MTRIPLTLAGLDDEARAGVAKVRGRSFDTPAFMPVGTAATVKGLSPRDLRDCRVQVVLANTYHLRLRPGHERIREAGGLHRFMGWDGPILTDSGGYQIFSLAERVKIDDHGASFRSHLDGEPIELSPEEVVRIQDALDSDIAMVLDQPVALPADRGLVEAAGRRTLAWAERSIDYHRAHVRSGQALFGIVQGAVDLDLRERQTAALLPLGFDGYAVGGLSVGETKLQLADTLQAVLPLLPADRPRYVMGIGHPEDLLVAIERGADMFDCVLPTRHARTGQAFTSRGIVHLRLSKHRTSNLPLDPDCDCEACVSVERRYLSHLYHADEMLGPVLVSRHNVRFYQRLVRSARDAILARTFHSFRDRFLATYQQGAD